MRLKDLVKEVKDLKILPEYFQDILYHQKRFELRKDDKDYKVNDIIRLREIENNEFTSNEIYVRIIYILRNVEKFGLDKDFCIFGFEVLYLDSYQLLKVKYYNKKLRNKILNEVNTYEFNI